MTTTIVAFICLVVGYVLGWVCGAHLMSAKHRRLVDEVHGIISDVRTLKAEAAKVQVWADANALEQHQLRAAADLAREEALKAARVVRTLKPTLRLIQQTHNRDLPN